MLILQVTVLSTLPPWLHFFPLAGPGPHADDAVMACDSNATEKWSTLSAEKPSTGVDVSYCACELCLAGRLPKLEVPFGGPNNKDYSFLGSMLGFP